MKKWIVYLLGILTGFLLTIIILILIGIGSVNKESSNITYAEQPSVFNVTDKFKVFQVLTSGALAHSRDCSFTSSDYYGDPIVYLPSNGKNTYYDDQVIDVPVGGRAIQLGTFSYTSKLGERVVPVIEIQVGKNSDATHSTKNKKKSDGEINLASKPTIFNASTQFKVKDVLENGVTAESKNKYDYFSDPIIYIPADGENMYYDDQIINIPAGKKAYQIGTIKLRRSVLPVIEFK